MTQPNDAKTKEMLAEEYIQEIRKDESHSSTVSLKKVRMHAYLAGFKARDEMCRLTEYEASVVRRVEYVLDRQSLARGQDSRHLLTIITRLTNSAGGAR